jgi:hypothetical protein
VLVSYLILTQPTSFCDSEKRLRDFDTIDEQKSKAMAVALEKVLYTTANEEEGHDPDSLDHRLFKILDVLIQRRLRKEEEKEDREATLRRIIGEKMSLQVMSLVREVKSIRLARVAVACGSCQHGVCPTKSRESDFVDLPKHEKMPDAVRNLFFNIRLVQVIEQMPTNRWKTVNWNEVVDEARLRVQEYNDWILTGMR